MRRRRRYRDPSEPPVPTVRLSTYEKDRLIQTMDTLLARHLDSIAFPLDLADAHALWMTPMLPPERTAWEALHQWGQAKGDLPLQQPSMVVVPVTLPHGVHLMMQLPTESVRELGLPIWSRHDPTPVDVEAALGPTKAKVFCDWAYLAVHTFARVMRSKAMVCELIDMANTVGQLNRMAPELVRYTHLSKQQAFAAQERKSALSDAWQNVDRVDLHATMDHLSLCHLLPAREGLPDITSVKYFSLWIWPGNYMGRAAVSVRSNDRPLSTYELPRDLNPSAQGTFVNP